MANPKTCHPDPAETIRQLRSRVAELIEDAARWTARADKYRADAFDKQQRIAELEGLLRRSVEIGTSGRYATDGSPYIHAIDICVKLGWELQ